MFRFHGFEDVAHTQGGVGQLLLPGLELLARVLVHHDLSSALLDHDLVVDYPNLGGNGGAAAVGVSQLLRHLALADGPQQLGQLRQPLGRLRDRTDPSELLLVLLVLHRGKPTLRSLSLEHWWQMHLSTFSTYYKKPKWKTGYASRMCPKWPWHSRDSPQVSQVWSGVDTPRRRSLGAG